MKDKEAKKDKECIHCTKFFDCSGKPKNVKHCLQFNERGKYEEKAFDKK